MKRLGNQRVMRRSSHPENQPHTMTDGGTVAECTVNGR